VTVVLDRPDMGRRPELDPGSLAGDVVVPANETSEPFGQRIDDAFAGNIGSRTASIEHGKPV
jgi:hypothetical protein